MVFALPFSKSIIEICVSAGLVLLIAKKVILKNYRLPDTPANLPLLFIFITAAISLINSQYLDLSLRALISKNLKFIALFFIVVETIDNRTKIMNFLKMGLLSAIIVFADTLVQYFITHTDPIHNYLAFKHVSNIFVNSRGKIYFEYFIGYPTGPFPYPNDLSAWLLIVMPILLFVSLFDLKNKLSRYPIMALSFLGIYIFVLAKARGAWCAFTLAMLSLVFLVKKKSMVFLILAVMLIIMIFSFANSLNAVFGFTSLMDRGDMWTNGVKIFKEHPVIGNGINTFFNKYRYTRTDKDRGRGSYAHNCYLQMAADVGILGLATFLWFVFCIIRNILRYLRYSVDGFYRPVVLGLLIGLTSFLIHSLVDTNLYSLNLASFFWLTAGFSIAIIKVAESKT